HRSLSSYQCLFAFLVFSEATTAAFFRRQPCSGSEFQLGDYDSTPMEHHHAHVRTHPVWALPFQHDCALLHGPIVCFNDGIEAIGDTLHTWWSWWLSFVCGSV